MEGVAMCIKSTNLRLSIIGIMLICLSGCPSRPIGPPPPPPDPGMGPGAGYTTPIERCVRTRCAAPPMVGYISKSELVNQMRIESWTSLKRSNSQVNSVHYDQALQNYSAENKVYHDRLFRACSDYAMCKCNNEQSNCTSSQNAYQRVSDQTHEFFMKSYSMTGVSPQSPNTPIPHLRSGKSASFFNLNGTYRLKKWWPPSVEQKMINKVGWQGVNTLKQTTSITFIAENENYGSFRWSGCIAHNDCVMLSGPLQLNQGTLYMRPGQWLFKEPGKQEEVMYFNQYQINQFQNPMQVVQYSNNHVEIIENNKMVGWVSSILERR